jgi:uncharacterized cupredoxin-like copper-binding protein
MPRTRIITFALALALVVVVGGCGGDDDDNEQASGGQTTTQQTTTSGGEGGAVARNATVAMTEYEFSPSDLTIRRGGTITVSNDGQISHDLTVEQGPNPNEETKKLAGTPDFLPGKSERLTVDLKAGKYAIVCRVPGHRQQGMTGTLTVR